MGKLDENKRYKRQLLLDAAFEVFSENGVGRSSISEIADKAGVAKGTFYLYFKDKYDLRDKLISHKSGMIFKRAIDEVERKSGLEFDDRIIFVIDNIINQFKKDQPLLKFIAKNLSWGVFKNAVVNPESEEELNIKYVYEKKLIEGAPVTYDNPELMLFMVLELVSSTIYSAILYREPVEIDELKPYLYRAVRMIVKSHETGINKE